MKKYVSIDIGGTDIKYALMSENAEIIDCKGSNISEKTINPPTKGIKKANSGLYCLTTMVEIIVTSAMQIILKIILIHRKNHFHRFKQRSHHIHHHI